MRNLATVAALAVVLVLCASASINVLADDEKKSEASDSSFRCGKSRKMDLAEFKKKLMADCNLNKPFSTSFSDGTIDTTYFYCCHTK